MAKRGKSQGSRGGRSSSGPARRARPQTNRHYARTARVNTLLQEIVADYFERTEDEEIGFVTITGVEVDNDLNRAQVFITTFDEQPVAGDEVRSSSEADDERLVEAMGEHRKPVQAKIGREARLRKTPEVIFVVDPAVRTGARIEEILSSLGNPGAETEDEGEDESVPNFESDSSSPDDVTTAEQ